MKDYNQSFIDTQDRNIWYMDQQINMGELKIIIRTLLRIFTKAALNIMGLSNTILISPKLQL